jgi:hypothetical protein
MQQLLDGFLFHNLSIESFTRGMKLGSLTFFFDNPVSILLDPTIPRAKKAQLFCHEHAEYVRKTLSFRGYVGMFISSS